MDVNGSIRSNSVLTTNLYLSGTQVLADANEINILNGALLSTSELNVLDGILASTSELNVLNGILSSTSELNVLSGIDPLLSATELSLLVGRTGTLLDSNNISSYAVTSISAGSGLSSTGTGPGSLTINIGGGNGITVFDDSINVRLAGLETTTSKSSPSGLEITSNGLRMIGGCLGSEVLAWNSTSQTWECKNPATLSNIVSGTGVQGQVSFYTGTNTQSGSNNLFWNNTLSRLGIGTTNPSQALEVVGSGLVGGIVLGESSNSIGIVGDNNLLTLSNNSLTINGTLQTGAITAPSSVNTINGLVINGGNITTGSWNGSVITVPYGGTGTNTLTNHGIVVGSGADALRTLSLGTNGQILIGQSGSDPSFATLSGDIASISTSGSVAFANTGVVAGSYGSSNFIPQITVDAKGRITSASNIDMSSFLLPVGTEGQMLYNNNGTWSAFSGMFYDDTN